MLTGAAPARAAARSSPRRPSAGEAASDGAAMALVLACASAAADPARIAAAAVGVHDWSAALALGERHGLLALMHRRLRGSPAVPDGPLQRLRARAGVDAREALRMAGELRRVMDSLAVDGVHAAAYKGPALSVRAYGDPALRRCADLDLLVATADLPAAEQVLERLGYAPRHRFNRRREAHFRAVDGDYPWLHGEHGTVVELHVRVSSRRSPVRLPTGPLLERAAPVALGGGTVPALRDDDLCVALAVHGCKHRWGRLEHLAAFAGLVGAAGLNAEALLDRAAEARARRAMLLALGLAGDLLALPLSPALRGAYAADEGLSRLAAETLHLAFAPAADEGAGGTAANLAYGFRACDGAADRARFAGGWLFSPSPEDWGAHPLPDALFHAYRLIRPLRLAARYGFPRRRR